MLLIFLAWVILRLFLNLRWNTQSFPIHNRSQFSINMNRTWKHCYWSINMSSGIFYFPVNVTWFNFSQFAVSRTSFILTFVFYVYENQFDILLLKTWNLSEDWRKKKEKENLYSIFSCINVSQFLAFMDKIMAKVHQKVINLDLRTVLKIKCLATLLKNVHSQRLKITHLELISLIFEIKGTFSHFS